MPYCLSTLNFGLETYFSAILATDLLILAVCLDLLVVNLVTTREDRVDDLLARDVLYLTA